MGDGNGPPTVGLWCRPNINNRPKDPIQRLDVNAAAAYAYGHWLQSMIEDNGVSLVAIEKCHPEKHDTGDSTLHFYGMEYMAMGIAHGSGAMIRTALPHVWRKTFFGIGYPSSPKESAIKLTQALGWDVGDKATDEAEGCGIWYWAHIHHGNAAGVTKMFQRIRKYPQITPLSRRNVSRLKANKKLTGPEHE